MLPLQLKIMGIYHIADLSIRIVDLAVTADLYSLSHVCIKTLRYLSIQEQYFSETRISIKGACSYMIQSPPLKVHYN